MRIKISNPYVMLLVRHSTLEETEKIELAKKAFLFIVAEYATTKKEKDKALEKINLICPDAIKMISDEALYECFRSFCLKTKKKNEIVSPAELSWAQKWVKNPDFLKLYESAIYLGLLKTSSHWDIMRHRFAWTLSENEKREIAQKLLACDDLDAKRKLEVAEEFQLTTSEHRFHDEYLVKLLVSKHFNQADKIGIGKPDVYLEAIAQLIDAELPFDALEIAELYLSDHKELIDEIVAVIKALDPED